MGTLRRTFGRRLIGELASTLVAIETYQQTIRVALGGSDAGSTPSATNPTGAAAGAAVAAAKGFAAFAFDPPKGDDALVEADALRSPSALNAPSLVNVAD